MKNIKGLGLAVAVILIVLIVFIFSCAPKATAPAPAPEPTGPIKIGAILDLTGDFAGIGPLIQEGVELSLNVAGWEVAGRKIELIVEDSESSADAAVQKARKLVGVDKVDVILLPLKVEACDAVAAFCHEKGVVAVAPQAIHVDLLEKYSTLVGPEGPIEGKQVGLGKYAAEKLGYKTATSLCPDFVFGYDVADSFAFGFKDKGGTIVKEIFVPFGTMDFSPFLTAIGNPDCLSAFLASPADGLRFWKQFAEFGLKVPVVWPEIDGIEYSIPEIGQPIVGVIGCTPYTWRDDTAINKAFIDAYGKDHSGWKPNSFTESGYTSTLVYLEAVKATGGDTTSSNILNVINGLSLNTPAGTVTFVGRLGQHNMYITECKMIGGQVVLEPIGNYPNVWPIK